MTTTPRPPLYAFGDPLSPEEADAVIKKLVPKKKFRKKRTPAVIIAALHQYVPNLFDHEVNRIRGYAFDSGEAGFSHTFNV